MLVHALARKSGSWLPSFLTHWTSTWEETEGPWFSQSVVISFSWTSQWPPELLIQPWNVCVFGEEGSFKPSCIIKILAWMVKPALIGNFNVNFFSLFLIFFILKIFFFKNLYLVNFKPTSNNWEKGFPAEIYFEGTLLSINCGSVQRIGTGKIILHFHYCVIWLFILVIVRHGHGVILLRAWLVLPISDITISEI